MAISRGDSSPINVGAYWDRHVERRHGATSRLPLRASQCHATTQLPWTLAGQEHAGQGRVDSWPAPKLELDLKGFNPNARPQTVCDDSTWFNDMQRLSKMNKLLNQINKDIFVMIADEQTSAPRSIPLARLGCPGALLERSGREAQWNQVRTAQGHVGSKWLKPRWVDDMLCMCVRIYNIIYI